MYHFEYMIIYCIFDMILCGLVDENLLLVLYINY